MTTEAKTGPNVAEPAETETSRTIIVRIKAATHKKLRIRVAEEETSIQQWVEALIERELNTKGKKK